MNKFCLTLFLLCITVCSNLIAATVTGALTGAADATITYTSVDAHNRPITLSGKIYYKSNANISFVLLNCHPTITHTAGCPSGDSPQMEAIKYMVSEQALVVCPDYIGFGETRDITHPYMCSTLTARNVLDCYKAAIRYVKEVGKRTIASDYYTINIGYSQGGATALAFQRYLETEASVEDRKLVNLRGSVCGAGPYSQQLVFDTYETMSSIDYPVYLYYVLQGHREAFGETTMRGLSLQECFTPEFWAYCQGDDGLTAKLASKQINVDDLNTAIKNAGFTTFYSIIHSDYANRSSRLYRILRKTLEQSNLLAKGWTPATPIIFYHDRAGHDIVVPYAETEAALTRFVGRCSYVDAVDDYGFDAGTNGYLWHPAVFRERWGSSNALLQNAVLGIAGITGNDSYNFQQLDHRAFGARFYCQFLSERSIMRPKAGAEKYAGAGTAATSNIDPDASVETEVLATESSQAGKYDRITTAMPYAMTAGIPTFVQFPAQVDGFYFGVDAPRYRVTLSSAGEAIDYVALTDADDFLPGQVYLVTPEQDITTPILSLQVGKRLATVQSDLAWRQLNLRPTTQAAQAGLHLATAYMPFAYTSPAAHILRDTPGESGQVTAVCYADAVPAATGVLLLTESDAPLVLTPVLVPPATGTSSLLQGDYVAQESVTGLMLDAQGQESAWCFSLAEGVTLSPYTCYLPASASPRFLNVVARTLNGDVTRDNHLDMDDIHALRHILLRCPVTQAFNYEAADFSRDAHHSILDMVQLIEVLR